MKKFVQNFAKDFGWYFICVVTVIIAWSWVFGFLAVIKPAEKVCVFVGSNNGVFEKTEQLNETKPEYLKKVEVNCYALSDSMFETYFSIFGCETGDIIILPESKVTSELCVNYFSRISAYYQGILPNLGFYESEGIVFGLKIHNKETAQSLITCLDFGTGEQEENYYLFFNKKSQHISDLFDSSKKSDMDGAIKIAEKLLTL